MSVAAVLAWAAFAYGLLQGTRYLLGARLYLTCALRAVEAHALDRQQVDPGELRLLTLLDQELAAASFRRLGFGSITPLLTHYDKPLTVSIFVNERLPAFALVRRHLAPEYDRLVELEIRTAVASGPQIVTVNTPFASSYLPPGLSVEAHPGSTVEKIVARHVERIATGERADSMDEQRIGGRFLEEPGIESALALITASMSELRAFFRLRKWVAQTANRAVDRFTLRGALALTHNSRRLFGAQAPNASQAERAPLPAPPSESQRSLRVEADLQAVLQVADTPENAPGTPWPLLIVVALTALLSFVAMVGVWNAYVAGLILAAVAFHEAGHAAAMRFFGYRDVQVFFVPLLGAMTIGRPAVATVRARLAVLLAGPVPGLWLAVLLLVVEEAYWPSRALRISAAALLILNGLNLLPFTPLDGGRALETLSGPESLWRVVVHGTSAIGLLILAAFLHDPVIAVLGFGWTAMLPRQFGAYRLRRAVAAGVRERGDFCAVARAALEVMAAPRYARWRAGSRQLTARAIGRSFAESLATPADRRWGALAYASAWIPAIAAFLLLSR
jgi:Zn-dependent protease